VYSQYCGRQSLVTMQFGPKKKENKRGNDDDWIRYKKISDAGLKRMWVMVFIVRELNLYAHRIEKSDVSVNNEK
jgi:hypothetical protein